MRYDSANSRNFGYGKQIAHAGKNALRDCYNNGHHATVAAHAERWEKFTDYARENGIRDMREITRETVVSYAESLSEKVSAGDMKVGYAQNLISSVNVVVSFVREDKNCYVSPSESVGQRQAVRTTAPLSIDRERVATVAAALRDAGHERGAVALESGRSMGLRLKESLLLDHRAALQEAVSTGKISVSEGTKGGRGHSITREIPATRENIGALERGAALQTALGGKNLLAPKESFKAALDSLKGARAVIAAHSLKGFHESRAGYACERYQQLTGHSAPVVAGARAAPREIDQAARAVIARELGHGRNAVVAAYVGSAK